MNAEQKHVKQETLEVPIGLRVIRFCFRPFLDRYWSTVLAISLLLLGYAMGQQYLTPNFLIAASGVVSAIGLILTIKNGYLKNISTIDDLAYGFTEPESQCSAPADETYRNDSKERNRIHAIAYDEGIGVILIILAAIVNGLAPFLF